MVTFEILLGLVAFCVILATLALRSDVPVAVLLVIGGMGLALVPGLPTIRLEPELALALFLPPLLQVSAYRTDWPAFRSNLRPILLLAVGAVLFTAGTVAVVARWLAPELPWWAAIALGAIVAPPDAVAASSVLRRFQLPKRIRVVLEGESLINDASSLVLYRFAVASVAVVSVSYVEGVLHFLLTGVGGVLIGWAAGRLAMVVFARIEDTMLDITVSILAGYAAYLSAELLHASGVLSAVTCGLLLGRKQHVEFTARTRLELNAVWNFVEFLLASLVFMLIGLQLRGITQRLPKGDWIHLLTLAAAVAAALLVSRFAWVYASALIPRWLSRSLRERDPTPPWTHQAVVSWAGMRGVVSLAAALALPERFPGRDLIVFLAFGAIFATLVLQGTTLGWLIHKLGVVDVEPVAAKPEVTKARAELADAALDAVKSHLGDAGLPEHTAAAAELVDEYATRAERVSDEDENGEAKRSEQDARHRLRLVAIDAARAKLKDHTDQVDFDSHRGLSEELDLEEAQIRHALGESSGPNA